MSWRQPRRVPKTGQVLDGQDLDDGLIPFVEEADGSLGEHNWSDSLQTDLTRATDLADDICMRVENSHLIADASDGPLAAGASGAPPGGGSAAINAQQIPATGLWFPIEGLSKTFTTAGGMLYALASMQLAVTYPRVNAGSLTANYPNICTMRVGMRVDGQVYNILTIGDQDHYEEGDLMEMGLGGWMIGTDIDGCVPLSPGSHVLDFVISAHVFVDRDDTSLQVTDNTEVQGEVLTRELIAVEIW